FRSMLARFATQSCRGFSQSSKLVSRNVQRKNVNPRSRGNRDSIVDDLADSIKGNGSKIIDLASKDIKLFASYVMTGASAFGIGALAYKAIRVGKENNSENESE
ncbi:hypothetical protein PMAYCL1PPCAC_01365, partial [Pristionchus mayeri]